MAPENTTYTRRRFSALAGVGIIGLSGCLSGDDDDEPEDNDEEPSEDDNGEDDNGEIDVGDQPDDASAVITTPEDGDTVESPVEIEAEAEGIELAPAGEATEGEGHLHVLVDHEGFEEGETIPGPGDEAEADGIYHWGDGQSNGEIELEPGEYDLTLQIADGPHRAFGETDEITITVAEE
ncbi:DUF4399 domain-containing protein [Halostagnicola bangensis]